MRTRNSHTASHDQLWLENLALLSARSAPDRAVDRFTGIEYNGWFAETVAAGNHCRLGAGRKTASKRLGTLDGDGYANRQVDSARFNDGHPAWGTRRAGFDSKWNRYSPGIKRVGENSIGRV